MANESLPPIKTKVAYLRVRNDHTAPLSLPPVTHFAPEFQRDVQDHEQKFMAPGEEFNVNAAHWAAVKGTPGIKGWLQAGWLKVVEGGDVTKAEGAGSVALEDLPEPIAAKKVAAMSADALGDVADQRPQVVAAVVRRREALGIK